MKFVVESVTRVAESAGFRLIGCLQSDTEKEKTEILPMLCEEMKDLLGYYAREVQPEVTMHTRDDGIVEESIYYRLISLPELDFVLDVFRDSLGLEGLCVEVSNSVEYFPEETQKIFEFQLQCWKQQTGF